MYYLSFKLFTESPLQYSPRWISPSQIIDSDVVALVNPLNYPKKGQTIAYKLFGTEDYGFDFDRLSSLELN